MASFISLEHGASMKSGNRLPKMRNKFPESKKMTLRSPQSSELGRAPARPHAKRRGVAEHAGAGAAVRRPS
jgi:hypothetical protein